MNVQDYLYVQDYVPCTYLCPARMPVRMPACLPACTAYMHVYIISKYVIETVKYNVRSPR